MDFCSSFGVSLKEKHPDIVVYRQLGEKQPLVIDVTVRHTTLVAVEAMLSRAIGEKNRKYKDFFSNDIEFKPLPFSTLAHMPKHSYEVIVEIGRHAMSGFVAHAVRRVKCAIIGGAALRKKVLMAKFATTNT